MKGKASAFVNVKNAQNLVVTALRAGDVVYGNVQGDRIYFNKRKNAPRRS